MIQNFTRNEEKPATNKEIIIQPQPLYNEKPTEILPKTPIIKDFVFEEFNSNNPNINKIINKNSFGKFFS